MNVPERLGKYLLVDRIAVGGMAEIFKARAVGFGGFKKVLAIKRLHAKYCQDDDFIKMLIDEAKIAVQLSHRNIGQIFDLDRIGDQYFICMEYIDGRDLNRMLRRTAELKRDMPLDIACFVAKEVCAGLDFAHRKVAPDGTPLRIIHRDVSPQNILISWEGEVKIIDFGIAKAALRAYDTESGIIKGKFYYMSPEQARGGPIDHRSDVFSLGVVLYEALTGELLFGGQDDDDDALLDRVRQANVTAPSQVRPEVPPKLDQIVLRALARSTRDRYQSAAAFGDALNRFLQQSYPRTDMTALAAHMRNLFDKAALESVPDPLDSQAIMSRVDYQVDISSLIFVKPVPDPDAEGEPPEEPSVNPSPEGAPMSGPDHFDDDPFFNDKDNDRTPRRARVSEVFELEDQDLEIVEDEPAEDEIPEEATDEVTTVRHRAKGEPPQAEPTVPDPSYRDEFDDEPTRVYRPQAVLAATPDAERGPLHGEIQFSQAAPLAATPVIDDEVTVITSIPEAPPEPRAKGDQLATAAIRFPALGPAVAVQPQTQRGRGLRSPIALVAILFLLVLLLGGVLAIAVRLLSDGEEKTTQIEEPASPQTAAVTAVVAPVEPQVASFYVTSIPAGAQVKVDGVSMGTTPTTVPDLEVGQTYFLRVEHQGFYAHEQQLRPASAGEQSIAFSLDPMLGVIRVETTPPGAAVSVNGNFIQNGPVTIPGLDTQSEYLVAASMPGYLTANQQVSWPAIPTADPVPILLALVPLQIPGETTGGPTGSQATTSGQAQTTRETTRTTTEPTAQEPGHELAQAMAQAAREAAGRESARESTATAERSTSASSTRDATSEPTSTTTRTPTRTESTRTTTSTTSRDSEAGASAQASTDSSEDTAERPNWRDRIIARTRSTEQADPASSTGSTDSSATPSRGTETSTPAASRDEPEESQASSAERSQEAEDRQAERQADLVVGGDSSDETGRVSVQAMPPAQVFIDGRIVATETPLINHDLPIGNHRVKVYFIDLRQFSEERTIRIVEGETRRLVFRASE